MSSIIESAGKRLTQEERFEKARTLIFPTPAEASARLAAEVADLIRARQAEGRTAVLGLATGSTPVPFYRELVRLHKEEGLSFRNVISFNLDEYCGLERDHRESYFSFMQDQLFAHVDMPPENVHVPDGTLPVDEVYDYCREYERKIEEAGGIDLQILGIGRTGHIGFNEPGSTRDSQTRMITLDRVTRQDAAADFLGEANVPRFAITMGVGTILAARSLVLMAWGENKAEIVHSAVEGTVTDQVSASFLQEHPNATFLVDTAAASQLTRSCRPWLVRSVTWDEELEKRSVVWLATTLDKPVLKLVDEEYNENGVGELLTEQGPSYDINIRVFNQLQHTITGWPGGKKGSDDTNRPERAQPYPKRVVIFSPEPQDAVTSMGGTIHRLVDQGHQVTIVYQTSGSLRVSDVAARKFSSVILEMGEVLGDEGWKSQTSYAASIIAQLDEKGEFGIDPENVRRLKGLILRGEARDASKVFGAGDSTNLFVDMPFYEKGRYRRFHLTDDDVAIVKKVLERIEPHQIFATGSAADPSSVQALCFTALRSSLEQLKEQSWLGNCFVWLYRGRDKRVDSHEIDMAVPMSPDQLALKMDAVRKFQSIGREELSTADQNREIAKNYDSLGMAEYEAIEAFQRWRP